MSLKMKMTRLLMYAALGMQAVFLCACNFHDRGQSTPLLHTTISADGQMIATLLNAGTDKQLLRVFNLKTASYWVTLEAPLFTQTIRFGLQGHELLLTHRKPDLPAKDYLSKFDLDKPEKGFQKIYESEEGLAFPVEVRPGQIMVRTRRAVSQSDGSVLLGYHYWILLGPGEQVQKVGPQPARPYSAPDIVGQGFFWTEDQIGKNQEAHPQILSFPLPNGVAPEIPRVRLEKNTFRLHCDHLAKRCLRSFISNLHQKPATTFEYDADVLFGSERCQLAGVAGWIDGISITPDGNSAVMSLASAHEKTRHVVVMHFNPQQCEAISVQHINFKGE